MIIKETYKMKEKCVTHKEILFQPCHGQSYRRDLLFSPLQETSTQL